MSFIKNQIFKFAKSQGIKAGIVPVKTPENEISRVEEVKRLGILNKDLKRDRRFNSTFAEKFRQELHEAEFGDFLRRIAPSDDYYH